MNPTPSPAPEAPELLPIDAKTLALRQAYSYLTHPNGKEPNGLHLSAILEIIGDALALSPIDTRATAPAPASGWTDEAQKLLGHLLYCIGPDCQLDGNGRCQKHFLDYGEECIAKRANVFLAKPAPDVAKLEAEAESLKRRWNLLDIQHSEKCAEVAELKAALGWLLNRVDWLISNGKTNMTEVGTEVSKARMALEGITPQDIHETRPEAQ